MIAVAAAVTCCSTAYAEHAPETTALAVHLPYQLHQQCWSHTIEIFMWPYLPDDASAAGTPSPRHMPSKCTLQRAPIEPAARYIVTRNPSPVLASPLYIGQSKCMRALPQQRAAGQYTHHQAQTACTAHHIPAQLPLISMHVPHCLQHIACVPNVIPAQQHLHGQSAAMYASSALPMLCIGRCTLPCLPHSGHTTLVLWYGSLCCWWA